MIGLRGLSPEIRPLLDQERAIPAQPPAVRARAVARARAALAAGVVAAADLPPAPVRSSPWLASATLACVISAAVNVAAYQIRAHVSPVAASGEPAAAREPPPPMVTVARAVAAPRTVAPIDESPPSSTVAPRRLRLANADRSELRLLSRARAAVARADFAAALSSIVEHAHRFGNGHLAEEREALRIGALVGLGRDDEARRAATAFRARFPHSVLVAAVVQMSARAP